MLIVIVFTVYRNMPNLTAIEVARVHLAAKDKEKQDAGKGKEKEDETRKRKGAPAKGIKRKPTENADTETNVPAEAIPKEDNALHDPQQQV